ncbi:MAG: lysophospholipase [Oscillospiraceae bacterium]|jgi:pimeloyl-ACP methyl ester carboxylesterase|nr:lysophospholipase [Oscillospiraceae bacterium]
MIIFSRAEYSGYNTEQFLLYSDLDAHEYPREEIKILSGKHALTGYLYGANSTQGLIIISPGHRDPSDVKLYEITYFADAGWMVLCYDYTGCYNSEGGSMVGYAQAVYDLDAVIRYVESESRFADLPVMLFGHSLGGYASAAVLQFEHNVTAAIIASGFDTPKEQWAYSIKRYTGIFHIPLSPFTWMFTTVKYGEDSRLSAIDGINAVAVPILVISGTEDDFYGGVSPIYTKREQIENPNCSVQLMEKPGHNGHYDYFLSDAAVAYQSLVNAGIGHDSIDKFLFMEHSKEFMDMLNEFYVSSLE